MRLQKHAEPNVHIQVKSLDMRYGDLVVQENLNFSVLRGDIFIIMGGSGCGKSTLMRHLIGLKSPASGSVLYNGENFWQLNDSERALVMQHFGVLYQTGALWSSMTVAENVGLPLEQHTPLNKDDIDAIVSMKLALVGLAGFEDYYPFEISGGMRKRAGLARAMALDPDILFFDEPSAGLDPITAHQLDDLIMEINDSLGTTIVIVTHELPSIFAIGNNSVFLDAESKTMIASGDPKILLKECNIPIVQQFLTRGASDQYGEQKT